MPEETKQARAGGRVVDISHFGKKTKRRSFFLFDETTRPTPRTSHTFSRHKTNFQPPHNASTTTFPPFKTTKSASNDKRARHTEHGSNVRETIRKIAVRSTVFSGAEKKPQRPPTPSTQLTEPRLCRLVGSWNVTYPTRKRNAHRNFYK